MFSVRALRRRLGLLLPFLAVFLAGMAHADDSPVVKYGRTGAGPNVLAEIEEEHRLSLEFATPHTKWAQPYARGAVRVLVICQTGRWNTLPREAVELMQRFDFTVDNVLGDFDKGQDPGNLWIGGKAGEERMNALLDKPHDVLLFMHMTRKICRRSRARS